MLRLALLTAFVSIVLGESIKLDFKKHWIIYKEKYGKEYDKSSEDHRRSVFEQNLLKIINHNLEADIGLHSYRLGISPFTDMTAEERQKHKKCISSHTRRPLSTTYKHRGLLGLPDSVDWREKGLVTPIKDQGDCGSCWAFSAVASLEGQHAKTTGQLVSLSEQNLVDCSGYEGNNGCLGGLMDLAFQYIEEHGIDTEASYPYQARDQSCKFNESNVGATMRNFIDIMKGDEKALQEAVATIGPVSIGINAADEAFHDYKGGVYDIPICDPHLIDHGVTVVGYGTDEASGLDYWLVKNSWGEDWGEKGYIKMVRNKSNKCGVASKASYPLV